MQDKTLDKPGVVTFPPRIFATGFAASLILQLFFPLRLVRRRRVTLAAVLIGAAVTLIRSAFRTMRKAGTNIDPEQPSTALVTEGPFHYTRNPIYVSLTLLYAGLTLLFNSLWAALVLPIVLRILTKGVVEREEKYLEGKFGQPYQQYQAQVPRWF